MGNVGNSDALIVNSNWILKQGTDQYILKNNITLNLSRPRFRDAIEIGPTNTFGSGDHTVPCVFEADITLAPNWANLNARDQLTGFLPNLPYTLTMQSKAVATSGSAPAVSVIVNDGKITSTTIETAGSGLTSVLLSLSGGGDFSRVGKLVGIVSEGALVNVIVIDAGEGYESSPTVIESEVSSPFAFEFNAEVSDVEFSPSDNEGRVKINATLVITDDAVLPVNA